MCMNKVMYLIPRRDGHVLCGSSMRQVGFDTSPSAEIRQDILEACLEMVPELADFPIVNSGLVYDQAPRMAFPISAKFRI